MRRLVLVVVTAASLLMGAVTPAAAVEVPRPSRSSDAMTSASPRRAAVSVDPTATSLTAPFDGLVYAVVLSREALLGQSLALASPSAVKVCSGCAGGETGAGGTVAKGGAIVLTHNGHPSTDSHWTRLLDQSTSGTYAAWTLGFEDQNADTGDFNDL